MIIGCSSLLMKYLMYEGNGWFSLFKIITTKKTMSLLIWFHFMKLHFDIVLLLHDCKKKNLQKFTTKIELIHIDNQADNLFSIYIDRSGDNVTENWTIWCLWTRPVLTLLPLLFLPWFTVRSLGFTACCFRPVDFDLLSYKIRRSTNREPETAGKRSVNCFSGPFLWWALCSYSFL